MTDDAFIQAILVAPSDDVPRLIYADWLEERGDRRGAFLRAEVAFARAASADPHRRELHGRLRDTSVGIDLGWLAVVSRVPVENCGVAFQFRCPKRWESLTPTPDESVRFCDGCRQQVFFCYDIELAQTHAAVGECIAVDPRLVRRAGDLESNLWERDMVMGLPTPQELSPPPKEEETPSRLPQRDDR